MGIKQTNIESFLEPESSGFLYDTARSFLKRHSNPESLLSQLKGLLYNGQTDQCRDMIQLILREGHPLADSSSLYLLRASVAYEESDNIGEIMAWLQQARICSNKSSDVELWDQLIDAKNRLADGDYVKGQLILENLVESDVVGIFAQYELAYHLFWKNLDCERAAFLLEEVVKQRPGFVKAWSCLGYCYNKFGIKSKAQMAFGQCIEIDTCPDRLKVYKQQIAS